MALDWNDSLLVGNTEIDDQHRQIFVYFEKLATACQQKTGELVIKELLNFIGDYVETHFLLEEDYMAQNSYPKLPEQQEQHTHFKQIVKELKETDTNNIDPHQLSLMFYQKLIQWFIQHIKKLDQEMVTYIVARQGN